MAFSMSMKQNKITNLIDLSTYSKTKPISLGLSCEVDLAMLREWNLAAKEVEIEGDFLSATLAEKENDKRLFILTYFCNVCSTSACELGFYLL